MEVFFFNDREHMAQAIEQNSAWKPAARYAETAKAARAMGLDIADDDLRENRCYGGKQRGIYRFSE